MKVLKKAAVTTMALAMGVSTVTACGTKSVSMPQEPKDIVKLATERTNALDSYELKGTMGIGLEASGQKIDIDVDMNAIYFKEPMKMKMDMTMKNNSDSVSDDQKEMTVSMYFMKEDENYVMYTNAEDKWSKVTMKKDDEEYKQLVEMLDKGLAGDASQENPFADLYKKADEQPKDQTMLDLSITMDKVLEEAKKMGALDQYTKDEQNATVLAQAEGILKQFGEFKISMGVDNDNVYWKSFTIDWKDTIQNGINSIMAMMGGSDMKVAVNKCDMNMTYENYNKATDFELPEEAKNAEEVDSNAVSSLAGAAMK